MFRPRAEEMISYNFGALLHETETDLFKAFWQFGGFINKKYATIAIQNDSRLDSSKKSSLVQEVNEVSNLFFKFSIERLQHMTQQPFLMALLYAYTQSDLLRISLEKDNMSEYKDAYFEAIDILVTESGITPKQDLSRIVSALNIIEFTI